MPCKGLRLLSLAGLLLNEYEWDGFLTSSAPDHPTFVDGRGAALYPARLTNDFHTAVGLRAGYRAVLATHDISRVLIRPDRALAAARSENGWLIVAGKPASWILLQHK